MPSCAKSSRARFAIQAMTDDDRNQLEMVVIDAVLASLQR
jgi:hypothetical protein